MIITAKMQRTRASCARVVQEDGASVFPGGLFGEDRFSELQSVSAS